MKKAFSLSETGTAALEILRLPEQGVIVAAGEKLIEKAADICQTDTESFRKFGNAIGKLAFDISKSGIGSIVQGIKDRIFNKSSQEGIIQDANLEIAQGKKLVVWLIHPTNYRQNGEPRKFEKQILPTNAISQLAALLPDQIKDGEETIKIEVHFLEDTSQPFDIDAIEASMQGEQVQGVVMLCGIQTNQWVRALNLAELCQKRGIPVVAGGYHVRADLPISQKQAAKYGMSLAIGEGEAVMEDGTPFLGKILDDAWQGNLQPEYRQAKNPVIDNERLPTVLAEYQELMINPNMATLETSRGCPLPCSFCTIRTIGGTEVRARSPEKMKEWIRQQYSQNKIETVFITDDNFAKSSQRFEVLGILAQLRAEGVPIRAMVQVDTMATIGKEGARFAQACEDAGVYAVFLGIESVDPATLKAMDKPQNRPERYKDMIDTWHKHNILTQCGFILGSKEDKPGVGKRSARALLDMGIDIAAAYVLTPLPGSVDYHRFHEAGFVKDPDFNAYDSHSRAYLEFPGGMSRAEVMKEYDDFYSEFFAVRNLPHLAERLEGKTLIAAMRQWFWYMYAISKGDHPMYSGWGTIPTDYRRSDFADNTPAVDELAPSTSGPGSPALEKRKRLPLSVE